VSASRAAGILFGLVSMAACGGLAREETVAAAPAVAEPAAADLLPAGRRLGDGLLVGAQPSLEQLGRLHDLGYRTAVSLRTEGEGGPTPEQVEALGLSFLRLPVADDRDVDRDRAQTLDVVLGGVEGPVVLYCGSGNRVGALLALRAHYVGGLPPEEALRAGREAGLTGLEPVVRERLGLPRE
jgi:uncharacterized protein (TIGR01244 family)